ncbi:MAG: protein kinase [Isosphaerales bacterium]
MSPDLCPDLNSLHRLLDEVLEREHEAPIVAHLEICKLCQDQLEKLTAGRASDRNGQAAQQASESRSHDADSSSQADPGGTTDFGRPTSVQDTDGAAAGRSEEGATGDYNPEQRLPATDDVKEDLAPRDAERTVTQSGPQRSVFPVEPGSNTPHAWPTIPGYELVSKLGEGGMGVVFLARQTGLNRLVAVKMIRGGSQARADHFSRFRIEAEAVAELRHPNIVQIHDIGEVDGLPFFSLELLEGGSLDDRLAGTPQPGRHAAELIALLARAVGAAHAAGIIHRDLKPSNVLYTVDGIPKVTDFGLAKRMESDSRQTESGAIMGSPSYMAPEQARGHTKDVGPAADVYALGAILYEMLTGRPPFKGETPIDTVRQVIDDEVVPPSRLVPKVARDLETICLKCLNKEPSKRYPGALSLVEDLERYRNGETIRARRTPPLERGIKWVRRRPARAALLGVAIAGFPVLTLGAAAYEHNRRIADGERSQRTVRLTSEGNGLIGRAREANSPDDLSRLQVDLSRFLGGLTNEDEGRLEGLAAQVRASFDDLQHREEKQKTDLADRRQFQTFLQLRAQAQLDAVEFELDPSNRRARLRNTTRKALAVYAQEPQAADGDWIISGTLPGILSASEKMRVTDGCYDLLLMLSQTTERATGLKILDRAAQLRPEPTAAYHLRRADCLAMAGDIAGQKREEALAGRRPVVTALDHFLIGREQLAKHEWSEAISSLERSIRLDPEQIAAQLLLAICEYNAQPKRLREARDNLSACLRRHPELVELYLLRARVQGDEGNQSLAQVDPDRPEEAASLRRQAAAAFDAALADYGSALGRLSTDDFRYVLLVNRGGMYLQAGRFAESRADLAAAVELKPELYQAYATLGQLYQRQGRLDEAFQAFGQAIKRAADPANRVALHRTRALLYADRRDASSARRAAALHDLEEAIRLEPENASQRAGDMVERARIYFGGAQFEEALSACGDALGLVPEHTGAHQLRISTLVALKRFDDVLSSCDAYLAREKPTIEILEIRGLARVARQNYSGAIADYTRALDLRSDLDSGTRSRLLNRRGWAYHFADAPRLALDEFEASLKLDKDQSDAHAGRGLARVRLGDWRNAVADAEAAVRLARGSSASNEGLNDQAQAEFNAARIYAQAVEYAAREVGREGERAVRLYRGYRARAIELLDKTLRQIPDPARRNEILSDPALRPIHRAQVRSASRKTRNPAPDHDNR